MEISWINVLVMAGLSVGNAALIIAVLNRIHSRPWPHALLHRLRQVHDLLILAFPLALIGFAGINGPRLLYGGEWRQLPVPVLAYLMVCGAVACAVPFIAVMRLLAVPAVVQLSNHSETIDIAKRLGYRPVGRGPYRFMANLPGNEFLKLQVSDKEFRLARLPAEWDGLSILHLSDLHFIGTVDRPYFEQVIKRGQEMKPDLVVFTGDLLDREELIDWLPATLGRLSAPLGCWFILGNHDWYLGDTEPTRRRLEGLGWQDIAGRCVVIPHREKSLAIGGTEVPWMGRHPDFSSAPADAFRLLLSHTPDNTPWARRQQVDLVLAGHNHGGQVRLPLFGPVYSPSAFGCHYASGVFWEPPTLLHVSRGISGRHPLRLNCPPELVKVVLRTAHTAVSLP